MAIQHNSNRARLPENPKVNNAIDGHPQDTETANILYTKKKQKKQKTYKYAPVAITNNKVQKVHNVYSMWIKCRPR